MENRVCLNSTVDDFTNWLRFHTRHISLESFQSDNARLTLQPVAIAANFTDGTRILEMETIRSIHTMQGESFNQHGSGILFRLIRLAPDRIEVIGYCTNLAFEGFFREIFSDIEIQWSNQNLAIANAPASLLWERRIQASAIFLFLSGMRVGAFSTLPLIAVDISSRKVTQSPGLGVKTKNSKDATTYLLNIPPLLEIVQEWDQLLRDELSDNGLWFAMLSSNTDEFIHGHGQPGMHRHTRVRKDLKRWCDSIGLPYYAPHRFRHGHAVYAMKQAQDMADMKAISLNLMHSSVTITDGIYGIMTEEDVSTRIGELGAVKSLTDQLNMVDYEHRLSELERKVLGPIQML